MQTTVPTSEESTKRVAAWFTVHGTRLQRRAIATGKATKRASIWTYKGLKNQVVEPYSIAKMVLAGLAGYLVLAAVAIAAFYITLVMMAATGSIIVGFLLGLMVSLGLVAPIGALAGNLLQAYMNKAKLTRLVQMPSSQAYTDGPTAWGMGPQWAH